jgi:hypothetical protein
LLIGKEFGDVCGDDGADIRDLPHGIDIRPRQGVEVTEVRGECRCRRLAYISNTERE